MEKNKKEMKLPHVLNTSAGEMPDPKAKSKAPSEKEIISALARKKPEQKVTKKSNSRHE